MGMMERKKFLNTTLNYTFSKSRITPYGGLLIPGRILKVIDFDRKVDKFTKPSKEFKNSEILKAMMIGILHGDVDYEAIHETDDDPEYFCNAMNMSQMPSEATMRQRMDEIGNSLEDTLGQLNVDLLKTYNIEPSPLPIGYVPIDIDVSPFINEKCHKEKVSKTYKLKDGYAPIFAYIGTEGYLLACELREGKQHCQCGTEDFLKKVIKLARQLTDKPLLVRLDSGNDAAGNIGICMEECYYGNPVHYIIKRNLRKELPTDWLESMRDVCTNVTEPREGKKVYIGQTYRDVSYKTENGEARTVGVRTIYDITERLCDHDGQYYVMPKVECDMYSVSIDLPDEEIIELYHQHGEMEQYHSEIKTDMDAEQLPSKYFKTNQLVLQLIQLSYNMLRVIGQTSLQFDEIPMKRSVKRRRLATVIKHIIMTPAQITSHARQKSVDIGKSNPWRRAVTFLLGRFEKTA